ncbi:Hypothetical predicted protein [Lecanosticta acicola]|uniref:Uncharacterized protein n=1 Tax=Lecanosticta acicola TaxID=111012 RepID=A0AAI8YRU1_9PEZI|nr:Hypothetical predicted protein [Lecanosticta acicola]
MYRSCGEPPLSLIDHIDDEAYTTSCMASCIDHDYLDRVWPNKETQSRARCNPRCRLLELPAELRIAIYEYALGEPFQLGVGGFYSKPNTGTPKVFGGDAVNAALQPSLTRVSRQLREESLPLFYRQNRVMLAIHYRKARGEVDEFLHVASRNGAVRANLCNVTIKHRFGILDFKGVIDLDLRNFRILTDLWYSSIPPMIAREVVQIVDKARGEQRKRPDELLVVETLRLLVEALGVSAS